MSPSLLLLLLLLSCAWVGAQPPCALSPSSDDQTYLFHVDVWPLSIDGDDHIDSGTELEGPTAVADRFAQKIARDAHLMCCFNVEFPLFTYYALRDYDQNVRNAPLAVEKRENGKVQTDKTMTEVWRHVCWTTDRSVRDKYLGTTQEEVQSSASRARVALPIAMAVAALVVAALPIVQ